MLGRPVEQGPAYCFLGDFSRATDPSRPAALLLPLASLPADATTFTLGDSMTVAEEATRRVYVLAELSAMFADAGSAVAGFDWSDRDGFSGRFIEVQVWDRSLFATAARTRYALAGVSCS